MKLYKLNYKENLNNPEANPWEIQDLILGDLNLIVGENSSGKSRTIRVINNFAKIISMPTTKPLDGEFYFEFVYDNDKKFVYKCKVEHQKVAKELITVDKEKKLERDASKTLLYSETEKNYINIHPPIDKLVLHVRRDKKEYPFLERLIGWANNTQGFYFGNTHPDYIEIPKEMEKLESLNVVPSVLEQMRPSNIQSVIKDFKKIGYFIESARADIFPGVLPNIKMISLKEKGLKFNINQLNLSQGMFRAFSLLVIIQHILDTKKERSTILVDDLCEGLDYNRSIKLAKLLFSKLKNKNIQFIVTSNDSFLMNAVNIECWNILMRKYSSVRAFNYENSKKQFEDFKYTGLNNFDLFSSDFLIKRIK